MRKASQSVTQSFSQSVSHSLSVSQHIHGYAVLCIEVEASSFFFHHFIAYFKIYILQSDWPADSYASLGGPVYQ